MILKTKAGEHVDIRTIAKQVIIEKGGIAKAADFVQAGIHSADVVNMCNAGYLDRIRHGYYQLAEADTSSEEQLLAVLIPKGIVCVESALFHYGYSDCCTKIYVSDKTGSRCTGFANVLCSTRDI